jgi:hypothetical protein
MPVESLPYLYTTKQEMQRIFTVVGFNSHLEDLTSDAQTLVEIIEEATDFINQYCSFIYEEADLATSRWARSRCTWYACHLLSQRGANPGLFYDRIEKIEQDLKAVFKQQMFIPRVPTRSNMAPALSNVIVDDRHAINKIRVHQSISPGGTSGRQDISYIPPAADLF